MLGADPEFVLRNNRKLIYSSSLLPNSLDGEIGIDGDHRTGEIRPSPADTGEELFCNIKALLERTATLIPSNYTLLAGSCHKGIRRDRDYLSTGGHIHFSNDNCSGTFPYFLNFFLAYPCLFLESHPHNVIRRSQVGYGNLGDIRSKTYGIEYRIPASFIITPRVCKIYLSLASLLHWTFTSHADLSTFKGIDFPTRIDPFLGYGFRDGDYGLFEVFLPDIEKGHYKLLRLYKQEDKPWVRQGVNLLWDAIHRGWRWNESLSVLKAWRIENKGHGFSIEVNPADDYLPYLAGYIEQRGIRATSPLYIYGLRQDRGDVIATNIPNFKLSDYQIIPPVISHVGLSLGIGYQIREALYNWGWEILINALRQINLITEGGENDV